MAHSSAIFWCKRLGYVDDYFQLVKQRLDGFGMKQEAALKIATAWKRYYTRKWYLTIKKVVGDIQRVYRGHRERTKFEKLVDEAQRKRNMDFYHKKASLIQALWKGYLTRRDIMDFYKRKEYLKQIDVISAHTRLQMKNIEEEMASFKLENEVDSVSSLDKAFLQESKQSAIQKNSLVTRIE